MMSGAWIVTSWIRLRRGQWTPLRPSLTTQLDLAMAAIAQQLVFLMARVPAEHVNETVMRYRDSFPMFETPTLQRLAFGAMAGIRLAVGMLRRSVTGDVREVIMHRSTWRRIMAKPYSV